MPPKKKGKGNTKNTKKKKPVKGSELEEKYRRSVLDVAVLKEHLALRTDVARQAKSVRDDLKCRMRDLEQELAQERTDMSDISADLNRQCKTMQTDTAAKANKLETQVITLQQQLVQCQDKLEMERGDRERMEEEKNVTIVELQSRLDNMETEYEKILHGSLDSVLTHLAKARLRWEDESTDIHQEYKGVLTDFGLNPLHI